MAYINPNSDVYILKGVPIDSDYNHTAKFSDTTSQYYGFFNYRKYTLNNQSYHRAGNGRICVAILADDLYDCNYLMFRNTSYGNKWFYAFLDSVEYVNDHATNIYYTIDVMQTWAFDYTFGDCFVEREHSITDEIGDNIVPENFELGDYITSEYNTEWNYSTMLGAIVLSKKLPDILSHRQDGHDYEYYPEPTFMPEGLGTDRTTLAPAGVPNGVYTYCGFPLSANDVNEIFYNSYNQYYMQDFHAYVNGVVDTTMTYDHPLTLTSVLDAIGGGIFYDNFTLLTIDDVVDVYIYPAFLNYKACENEAWANGMTKGVAMSLIQSIDRPASFYDRGTGEQYYPKNNKLFTYPYIKMHVYNNNGGSKDFIYEDFEDLNDSFRIIGSYANKGIISLFPTYYKGIPKNYEESIQIDNFPTPAYKGSQFASWLESNKFGLIGGIVSSAISGTYSMTPRLVGSSITQSDIASKSLSVANNGNFLATAHEGQQQLLQAKGREAQLPIPSISRVIGTIAHTADLLDAPPKIGGEINSDVLNVGAKRVMFINEAQTIKPQVARVIDDYFTMFGYATNRVKKPNIAGTTYRRYFNYIKTMNALILPATSKGLPASDIKLIQNIYDKGITFWNGMSNIGNYSLPNDIITQ